jgi:transposase
MFFPEGRVRVFLHGRPVDLRKSFTGLIALTQQALAQDPLSGHLFVFVNRRGDYLKALYWDRSGFCLWCKRLERGRFISDWRRRQDQERDVTGLRLLLEGIEPARRRLRYAREAEKRTAIW